MRSDNLNSIALAKVIRPAKIADAPDILDLYRPYVLGSNITFETATPGLDEMEQRILDYSKLGFLVCEQAGKIVGYAYASKYRERAAYQWCCEVSVYIHEKSHGQKIATSLYTALIKILKDCGYVNAYALITLPNLKSVRFHEGMGFKHVGIFKDIGFKLGQWCDVGWWGLKINESSDHPKPPLIRAYEL
jgi:L-amino acid N-acyltransferase YncA